MKLTLGAPFFRVLCGRVGGEAAVVVGMGQTCNPPVEGGWPSLSLEIDTVGAPPFSAFFAERVGRCTQILSIAAKNGAPGSFFGRLTWASRYSEGRRA
jgi:hypothetical protein